MAVEAQEVSSMGSAGVNLYGGIQCADGSMVRVMSDESWKVATTAAPGWMTAPFDGTRWLNAVKKPYPYTGVEPIFSRSITAWIKR